MAQAQPAFPDLFPPQVDTTFRVLSIDDDPIDRMRIRTLCRKAGVGDDIDEAHNITEMRALLDEGGYDIVFIDYHLGLETGREALDVLLQHEDQANAIPIMVTSVTDHQVAIDAMRAGCSDYLVKEEMSVETLRKSIVSSLERRILLSAVSEMRMAQTHMKRMVERFSSTCGPEMRAILGAMLRQIAELKEETAQTELGGTLTAASAGCSALLEFLDDLDTALHAARPMGPRLFSV
jgi:DNA-binding NarL/FixJ family response regulator